MRDGSGRSKRRFKRKGFSELVEMTFQGSRLVNFGVDLSEGGLMTRGAGPFKLHDRLNIGFVVPGETYLQTLAEVIYIREPVPGIPFLGLRFVGLSTWDLRCIRRYIRRPAR